MQDVDMVQIGQRIKELRTEHKLSQTDLAKEIGIAQNTLSQYENGIVKAGIEIIVKLAQIFKTSTDYILLGDEKFY